MHTGTFGLAVLVAGLTVAGCGGGGETAQPHQATVVASTDVWGSVASAVAGEHASVKSIVISAVDDPHSFEASPADAAAITDAALVVYNGGGYDHWVDDVLADRPNVASVNAYSLLPAGQPTNEHVFYNLDVAKEVASRVADHLAEVDPDHADDYRGNATEFGRQADAVIAAQRSIADAHPSVSVVATEPVAFYLLRNAGVTDRTPQGFAAAVEEGDDPSPADVAAVLDMIDSRQVSALVANPQTETAATQQIEAAARRASVPVVTVTETLPADTDYLTWQRRTVEELAHQLDKA